MPGNGSKRGIGDEGICMCDTDGRRNRNVVGGGRRAAVCQSLVGMVLKEEGVSIMVRSDRSPLPPPPPKERVRKGAKPLNYQES